MRQTIPQGGRADAASLEGFTRRSLADYLAQEVFRFEPSAEAEEEARREEEQAVTLAALEALSEGEAEALLLQELDANPRAISK